MDQALLVTEYFTLGQLETEYFLLLVGLNRAAHYKLKEHYNQQLKKLKVRALDLREYLKKNTELDDQAKQKFYSDWSYSAIRLTCSIETINTADEISDYLGLESIEVKEKLQFLLNNGLVTENDGKLDLGTSTTFLDKKNPLINTHRKNWRLKAMDKFSQENDLFLVAPMTLSKELKNKLHTSLLKAFNEVLEEVPACEAEELICVNIDLFSVN